MLAMCRKERRALSSMGRVRPFQNVSRWPIVVTAGFSARILADSRTLGRLSRYQHGSRGVGGLPHGATLDISPGPSSCWDGWLTGRTPCKA